MKYGEACVETTIYLDNVEFGGVSVENMPFGGAYRMTGFDQGFGMHNIDYFLLSSSFSSLLLL